MGRTEEDTGVSLTVSRDPGQQRPYRRRPLWEQLGATSLCPLHWHVKARTHRSPRKTGQLLEIRASKSKVGHRQSQASFFPRLQLLPLPTTADGLQSVYT